MLEFAVVREVLPSEASAGKSSNPAGREQAGADVSAVLPTGWKTAVSVKQVVGIREVFTSPLSLQHLELVFFFIYVNLLLFSRRHWGGEQKTMGKHDEQLKKEDGSKVQTQQMNRGANR